MNYVPGSSVMPFDGTSRVSRIASTIAHTIEDSYSSVSSNVFDKFFLIVDELGRSSAPSSMMIFILLFITLYQYYVTSYLAFLPDTWDFQHFPDKIIRYLTYPIDFGLGDQDIFEKGICSYLILILCALIMIYVLFIIIYYQINKIFPRYNAHFTRFLISFLIPIILPALSYNIGFSFNSIFLNDINIIIETNSTETNSTQDNNQVNFDNFSPKSVKSNGQYIASTIFGILFYFFLILIIYIDIIFRSSTPYLENTPLSMWDGLPFFLCILGTTLTIISSRIIYRFPIWSHYFLIACCVFYNLFILYKMFFFPMIKKWVNITISIVICSSIISFLFQAFPIPSFYRIIVPFCILIVLIPIFTVIFRIIRKKIASKEIEDLDLSKESHALRYLRITISDKSAEFATFRWIKPMNLLNTTNILCQMSQMISFFPSESQNLTFYVSILSKNHELNLHQRFLYFQLRRVHILRQSSTSKQLNDDLSYISRVTNQSIASFSQFLIRTVDDRQALTIDRLRYLSRLNRSTNSLCHEAMSRYPNSSRLMFIFSRYVIECQADYKRGVLLYQEGQQIERGKRATVDYAFRSMVNLFPNYLWKRILDSKGNSITNRMFVGRRSKSGSSMSADSNEKNNQFSDTDLESNDKIAASVLDNSRLRFSLRRAVENMKSTGIMILILSSIFRFILSFAICIAVIAVASNFLNERSINYQNIAQIGKVRKSLDLSLFRMAKLWSYDLGLSPKEAEIKTALGSDVSLNDFHNFSINPNVALFLDVIDSIRSIEELGKLLIEVKYDDSMELSDKSTTDFVQISNISFCDRKTQSVIQSTTSIRYFSLYLLNQVLHSSTLDERYENSYEWKDDESICEVILNMHSVIDILTEQSNVLVSQEEEISKKMKIDIIIFFCICIPIAFAIFLIPFIAGYVKVNMEFRQIFDVLNLLPIKIYKDASKPIALFQADSEQSQEGVSQIEQKGCQKIVILIPAIISSIVIIGSLIGVCFLILDVNNKFFAIVKWLEIGSVRTPLLIETVTNAIYAGIYGYLGDTDYTTLIYHLQSVFNYSQKLLYQHKTLIWGASDSTSCNNFSRRLDSLHFTNTCIINTHGDSFQTNYRCMSLDQQIMTFNKFAKDVYLTLLYAQVNSNITNDNDGFNDAFLNVLNGFEAINLHYLGISFLLPKLEAAQIILDEGINLKIEQLSQYSLIVALCTLAVELILFLIDLILINNLSDEYKIVHILIARLPPVSVLQTPSLIELITGQSDLEQSKKMTPIMTHINFCSSSVVIFDKNCRIHLSNLAACETFGFTKEQLFHAHLSTIINQSDVLLIRDKVNRNIESETKTKTILDIFKKNNNNDNFSMNSNLENEKNNNNFTKLTSLLNNDDDVNFDLESNSKGNQQNSNEKVDLFNDPVKLTLIGLKDDGAKVILSAVLTYLPDPDNCYALIMKDETKVYINESEIQKAKEKADNIIMQVLPRAISQTGKIKENISFSIKQVTMICIRIINFNDSIPHITSVQAIRNMSELFTLFDSQLINYPNLTKTSVISDSFQAVGGLFNQCSIRKISSRPDDDADDLTINNDENNENENEFQIDIENNNNNNNEIENNNSILIDNGDANNIIKNSSTNIGYININESNSSFYNINANINDSTSNISNIINNSTSNISNIINNSTSNISNIINNSTSNIINNNNNSDISNINSNINNSNSNISNIINNSTSNIINNSTSNIINDSTSNIINNNNNSNVSNINSNINNSNSNISDISSNNIENNDDTNNNNREIKVSGSVSININNRNNKKTLDKAKVKNIRSRQSIYDIKSLNPEQSVQFANIILDSIYFALNCISATEYVNNSYGTNYVLGIGISSGGPITAGTLGREHIQFEIVGGVLKESFLVSSVAEGGMIVINEETYKIVIDSFEAQKNLLFEKYKIIESLHSKKIDTYIVKPSDVLCPHVNEDDAVFSPQLDGENDEDQNDDEDEDDELLQMQEDQQILRPNEQE